MPSARSEAGATTRCCAEESNFNKSLAGGSLTWAQPSLSLATSQSLSSTANASALKTSASPPGLTTEHQPVKSTIPTLPMSGEYDPATPTSNAKFVARGLSRSAQITFPGLGRWVTAMNASDCPHLVAVQSHDTPCRAPDCTCIGAMRTR